MGRKDAADDLSPLPEAAYAAITCLLVHRWIDDKAAFLHRVRHLLAPGGTFWVVTEIARRHAATDPLQGASFAEWKSFLFRKDVTIRAESGYEVSPQEIEVLILERQDRAGRPLRARLGICGPSRPGQFRDAEGYELYDSEFC
ncbi:hypothetical protein [Streptomyces longispororuber]|uniref:hypothetical protein n=1 Tax=Streptomyces longispororuber TaxID=68230 RepID=UPI0036FDC793